MNSKPTSFESDLATARAANEAAKRRVSELEGQRVAQAPKATEYHPLCIALEEAKREVERTSLCASQANDRLKQHLLSERRNALQSHIFVHQSARVVAHEKAREIADAMERLSMLVADIDSAVQKADKSKADAVAVAAEIGESVDSNVVNSDVHVSSLSQLFVELQKKRMRATTAQMQTWVGHVAPVTKSELLSALRNIHSAPIYIPPHSDDVWPEQDQIDAIIGGTYYDRLREIRENRAALTEASRVAELAKKREEFESEVARHLKRNPGIGRKHAESAVISTGRFGSGFATT